MKTEAQKVGTLADCPYLYLPRCLHCEAELPQSAKAELCRGYVVVECPACGGSSPFRILEKTG